MTRAEDHGEFPEETEPESPPALAEQAAAEEEQGRHIPTEGAILLTVRGMALFPGVVLPIIVGRERSIRAVQAAVQREVPVGVILQRDPDESEPGPEGLYRVGTVAEIVRYITAPDGTHHIIAQGLRRFRVKSYEQQEPFVTGNIELLHEPSRDELESPEIKARFLSLKQRSRQALELLPQSPEELDATIAASTSPSMLTDMVATFMDLPAEEKQEILEINDLGRRMEVVLEKLSHLIEVLRLSQDIRQQTKGSMEKAQREYYLREQLKTIRAELGEGQSEDLRELAEQIEECRMPPEAQREALKELGRLESMPEASAEHGMVRSYLDWMVELPWSKQTEDSIDIEQAREILDADHYGLQKVKRRILEFLAVRKLNPEGKGPILCLVGPPGVGKTSLGQSVARAMGRKFVRVSLGGVHDESEIRGHRRTYVGAMPGNILSGLRKANSNNPVFMLDEMDKLGQSFQGDPSAALLEVLDPAQNDSFRDHYLNVAFDLSGVMFIGTANVLANIPGPLRDRCEVIELTGYTEEEKLEIARRYLLKRQLANTGLKAAQCRISKAGLRAVVRGYTREAGVRNLEREIGSLCRHVAVGIAEKRLTKLSIGPDEVLEILGAPRFENEVAARICLPGVATGLAWTPVGGELLFIEATRFPGKGQLILTGQLGDVMRESAMAALALVKSNAAEYGVDPELFEKSDIHVHVPAGAIPKDGPSAGVAMFVALTSLLRGQTVDSTLAMTGEISLRGQVLPVGGIKEKVLAAYNAGIKCVMLPARNEKDLEEVPTAAREKLHFILVERVEEALVAALEGGARAAREKRVARKKRAAKRRATKRKPRKKRV